jgi:glutaminyl-tRNA synthetase
MKAHYDGVCYLRFDDTNPIKEEQEYIDSISEDVRWLGFDWKNKLTYASDYYQQFFDYACILINKGLAYVDSLSIDKIREYRGTLQSPGKNSPYRDRTIEENLSLFKAMKNGEYKEGEHILRAKIDMASPNINLRDPALYRIRFATHHRTGDTWCIYPMYDFAHTLTDALENITHSLCTLEFQDHRPLYNWLIENANPPSSPTQIEFARLNLSHTITSKRKLKQLVDNKQVSGWDDPRMPTLKGMRNRGYPPSSIRQFCDIAGISKSDSILDMSLLEECVRDDLNKTAPRAMCVFDPIKVVIENYPDDKKESLKANVHPQLEEMGKRTLTFEKTVYIERDDFTESPPPKYFRLSPGKEVRLRNAYVIKCDSVIKNDNGEVVEIRCHFDENTLGKKPEGRKVKGVIHWVSESDSQPCDIRLLDRLFTVASPASHDDFETYLNPHSKEDIKGARIESSVIDHALETVFQFERQGYYSLQKKDEKLSFHRVVSLRDSWKK